MRTIEYLNDPMMREMYLLALAGGMAVVLMCGVLSVLVVVKRLGFVGQGVSHSAFGGIGVAAVLGALGLASPGGAVEFAVIVGFCIAAALGMGVVGGKRQAAGSGGRVGGGAGGGGGGGVPVDTAIGIFLVGSMALGAILVQVSRDLAASGASGGMGGYQARSWESILFGSILAVGEREVAVGWVIAIGVLAVLWGVRRPLMFWTFDESSAEAFGVRGGAINATLMVLLAVAVVASMKLAGVVLATALLVLPAATALKLSDRLWPVCGLSVGAGTVGLVGGLLASIELDWQPGPSVVLVMTGVFAAAMVWARVRR